jgi:hypothetical protein
MLPAWRDSVKPAPTSPDHLSLEEIREYQLYLINPNRSISQGLKRDTGQYDVSEGPWNGCRAKWVEGSRGAFMAPGGCGRASRMVG